jgi:tetratricopeptide (TPR) repeat protein
MMTIVSFLPFKLIEKLAIYVIVVLTIIEIVLGILQLTGISESRHLLFRMTGSFMNPNPYGGFLALSFSVLTALVLSKGNNVAWFDRCLKVLVYVSFLLITITRCRSAYLSVVICTVLIFTQYYEYLRIWFSNHKRIVVLLTLILFIILYIWKRPSADGRLFIYRIGLMILINNCFKGGGVGSYQALASNEQLDYFRDGIPLSDGYFEIPHEIANQCMLAGSSEFAFCDPLQIAIDAGIITLFFYIGVVVFTAIILKRRNSPLYFGLIALQITSLFSYSMSILEFQLFMSVCIGAALSDSRIDLPLPFSSLLAFYFITSVCLLKKNGSYKDDYSEWKTERIMYNAGNYKEYAQLCAEKIGSIDFSAVFLYEYGCSLSEIKDYSKSDSVLNIGVAHFGNPAFYMKLGDNSMKQHYYSQAEDYYWRAFCIAPNHLTPLCSLADCYLANNDTVRFNNMLRSIEQFNSKNEANIKTLLLNQLHSKLSDK